MSDLVQFGPYIFLVPQGDLYKGKSRIRLQQHPATVLLVLLERAGEVVTREEIRARVWPNGTLVEFDHGINTAVNRLRAVLGDRAEKPRYIETVARRGYRFVAPVRRSEAQAAEPASTPPPPEPPPILPDTVISHYRVLRLIGSGAVGQVYEALDLNLGRRVALKFLTEALLFDERTIERFSREARMLSALEHPNICGVYEFDSHGVRRFLVMQLLEGDTLAERIHREGRLHVDDLVRIGLQVATGLEAAHERGIIHRDVKPSNLFLTRSGQVKILDFGVAKLGDADDVAAEDGAVPHVNATAAGAVVGTAAYMSPEQIEALPLDSRTDIFSFGLVLYEMATGKHPFADVPDEEISQALLRAPIPTAALQNDSLPLWLVGLISHALEKDRTRRIQSMRDVRASLETHGSQPPRWYKRKAAIAALAALAALSLGAMAWHRPSGHTTVTVVPFTSTPGLKEHVSLSRDGSRIAFAWYSEGDNEDIFVQPINSQLPVRLTASLARDFSPAWSPDGRFVAFLRTESGRTGYFVVPAEGGPERKLGDVRVHPAPFCRQLDWSWVGGGHLAIIDWKPAAAGGPTIVLVSATEGSKLRELPVSTGDFVCAPAFSRDGRSLAFLSGPNFRVADVYVLPVGGGPERRITNDARMMQGLTWAPDGKSIVYSLRRSGPFGLWQVPLDGSSARPLLETGNDVVDPHWSGTDAPLIFVRDMWDTNLWRVEGPHWIGPRSGPVRLVASTREESSVDVSPDGRRIAFASARTGAFELWVADADGSRPQQLTDFRGPETGYPSWSPDGKQIAFNSYPEGQPAIFVLDADGGSPRHGRGDALLVSRR